MYNLQAAQGPSVLPPASISNPPCRTCTIASGARSLNRADPATASYLVPEAPEGCSLCEVSRRSPNLPAKM
eukprot:1631181-Alexandrium_andersonii.AAC.1